jgi:hypothetical protein
MDVPTITMDPELARAKLREYRQVLHRVADEEYEAAARGYEALAEGTPILMLSQVIREAGTHADGRPRLAIARADRKQVRVRSTYFEPRIAIFSTAQRFTSYPGSTLEVHVPHPWRNFDAGHALVPMTPPEVVQKVGGRSLLRDYFVLWEVEQWADHPLMAGPDRDPYLLKHLGADLYAVVAEWDLTELERAVMAAFRR